MIDLTQEVFNSSDSFLEKFKILRMPSIYIAEDMRDYKENVKNLPQPNYPRLYPKSCIGERVFISVFNVTIQPYSVNDIIIPNWFLVHDSTDEDLMYWFNDDSKIREDLCPTKSSFEQIEEGPNKGVHVYEVFFRYAIEHDLGNIVEVNKIKPIIKKARAKESLLEKIRGFTPAILEPQPAY